jgi:ribosome-associated protein
VTNLQPQRNARDISLRRDSGDAPLERKIIEGRELADVALRAALDRKALEPTLLDVSEICSYADYILIVSARSDRQVAAVSDAVFAELKQRGYMPLGTEGEQSGQWALIDYGEVIVHVFHHPTREFYDLESLWVDAKRIPIEVPDEARIRADQPIY